MKKCSSVFFSLLVAIGIEGAFAKEAAVEELRKLAEVEYSQPVRPIGVNGQAAWNLRSIFFMYPPTFGFSFCTNAAAYRFTVKDESGKEHVFTGRSPNDSLAPVWMELPRSGWVDVSCEAIGADGEKLAQVGSRSFWKQAPYLPGAYPTERRSPLEVAKSIVNQVMKMPVVHANYLSAQPVAEDMVRPDNQTFISYPSKMGAAILSACAKLSVGETEEAKAARMLAEGVVKKLFAITEPEGSPLAGFPRTYEWHPSLTDHPARMVKKNGGKIMLLYPAAVAHGYLDFYEVTKSVELKIAAIRIADLYLKLQGEDGTWPLNLWIKDGSPVETNRLVPVFMLGFLERMYKLTGDDKYRLAADRAFAFVENGPMTTWNWEGQFEDIPPAPTAYRNLTKHNACDMAIYLVERFPDDVRRLAQAREILRFAEDQFVCWEHPMHGKMDSRCKMGVWGFESWRCPGVLEQYNCYVPIDASAAKLVRTYLSLYRATGNPLDFARARTLGDALIRETDENGFLPTFWLDFNENWPNCMLSSAGALMELANCRPVSVSASKEDELQKMVAEDVAMPVRPFGVGGQVEWNGNSTWFMYPPVLVFPKGEAMAGYRIRIIGADGTVRRFDQDSSVVSLEKWWSELPVGRTTVLCDGWKPGPAIVLDRHCRSFWKMAPFRPGSYPSAPYSYADAAKKGCDYILNMKFVQHFCATGRPDPEYALNSFPTKMNSALIIFAVKCARADGSRRTELLSLAKKLADYLISISQPDDAPLAGFPPTYIDMGMSIAKQYLGMNMLVYPAYAGSAYLELFRETKDQKYLNAAKAIGETYLRLQGEDGTWPLKVYERDGRPVQANRLLPIAVIDFLDALAATTKEARYQLAADRAFGFCERGPLTDWNWEGQFEDVEPTPPYKDLSKHPAVSVAMRLVRRFPGDVKRLAQAREILRWAEDQFVVWEKPRNDDESEQLQVAHNWTVAPAVIEQYHYRVPVDASAAKMIEGYLSLYAASKNPLDLMKARALGDAMVRAQQQSGRIPTSWIKADEPAKFASRDWINCLCASVYALLHLAEF